MWRSPRISCIFGRLNQLKLTSNLMDHALYSNVAQPLVSTAAADSMSIQINHSPQQKTGETQKHLIGENVPKRDKINFLTTTLLNLNDSKEAVYGALDAWVAWENKFPMVALKRTLIALEKEQQWHRIVQVIKWMLSKGQGTTMGTYGQLIRALDMDHRVQEAHEFWEKKIGCHLHSVPWQLCHLMITVYYRNNMLEDLVRLFKELEAFDRKPRDKSIIQKVANAYEMLGRVQEKDRVLEKYSHVFNEEKSRKQRSDRKKISFSSEKGQH
ncbi:pentatricopeptide repeat-containing protein At4g18975, chloroplastic isoform X2 [Neltuma alba]|uniref:pentatricopeptide repeat-containing protein At4g18975, chloroplastic isoform X2 n=1 Tax=Neltuma alba TaxID=207710 RepID=UPI0010A31696|nr:pentatricopeptide repeat-containing protein At4g18975, chloroplastic isoform X2 [Prosopis alba]